jgi:hypothetical protein
MSILPFLVESPELRVGRVARGRTTLFSIGVEGTDGYCQGAHRVMESYFTVELTA